MSRPFHLPAAIALSALFVCTACPTASRADLVYRPNEGWTREGGILGISEPVAKTADLQMQYGTDLEKKGNLSGAREAYKRLIKVFPLARQAAEARFKLGGIFEKQGRYEEAFESYDELVVKHPESKEFSLALDAMYAIGKRYMNGERRRLLGLKMFASNQRSEEMFDTIIKRAPYSRSAAQVMLFRGMMMERQGKDVEALAAYQQVIERFPTDPVADDAQYQMGYIRLHSVKEGSYNNTDRVRAQESFEDFINRAPQNEKTTQARQNLQLIEGNNRKASLDVAKFYDKTGKAKAAVLSYEDVVRNFPGSQEADFAKKRIAELKDQKGEDALKPKAPTAQASASSDKTPATSAKAPATSSRKQTQAAANNATRPDYVGPRIKQEAEVQARPAGPALRLQDSDANGPLPANPSAIPSALELGLPAPRITPPTPQNP